MKSQNLLMQIETDFLVLQVKFFKACRWGRGRQRALVGGRGVRGHKRMTMGYRWPQGVVAAAAARGRGEGRGWEGREEGKKGEEGRGGSGRRGWGGKEFSF
jgi:hypothetical protein